MSSAGTMSVAEVAAYLGVHRKTVYEAAGRGEIPHARIGKRLVFSRAVIERWLAGLPAEESLPATTAGR